MLSTWNITTIVALSTSLSAIVAGCGGGASASSGASDSSLAPLDPPGRFRSVQFIATTDKTSYGSSDPVTITFTVRNTGTQPLDYDHMEPDTDLVIRQGGTAGPRIWQWSVDQVFAQSSLHTIVQPGESLTYHFTWSQRYQNGMLAAPGTYTIDCWANYCPGVASLSPGDDVRQIFGAAPVQITIR